MAWNDAVTAIKQLLAASWTTTPIALFNDSFDAPEGAPWVLLTVKNDRTENYTMGVPGNRLYRYDGRIILDVFVPINSGNDLAFQYANALGEIFRNQFFSNVRTWAPDPEGDGSNDESGNWYRTGVTIPYQYHFFG